MRGETPINHAPDWAALEKDLLCPLCEYNLRGLTEPRCPECGFQFTWQELINAEKNRHLYIFEHGKGRNLSTFWNTYWRTCQPRRFWNDLNPAQPGRLGRLMVYCIATTLFAVVFVTMPHWNRLTDGVYGVSRSSFWRIIFWGTDWRSVLERRILAEKCLPGFGWAAIFLLWPWLTLLGLAIFFVSVRQARIRYVHLLRTVIYSCDFGMLFIGFYCLYIGNPNYAPGWLVLLAGVFSVVITTYRLTIAFRQYLRVHLPLETVIASQLIAFLLTFLVLVQIVDFSRRI